MVSNCKVGVVYRNVTKLVEDIRYKMLLPRGLPAPATATMVVIIHLVFRG